MSGRKKNILMLITNLDFGGAQRVFYNMSEGLKKEYNVIECVFNKYDGVSFPTSNMLIDLNIPGSSNYISKIYYFILRCIKVRRIKKKYKIDICISHLEGADYVNIFSKSNEKTILWVHGSKFYDGEIKGKIGWLRKKILLPFLYKRADRIVCVSRDIREELIRYFKLDNKISVITNAFDSNTIYKLSQEGIEEKYKAIFNSKVVITSGRLAIQKNQKALLKVFSLLKDKENYKLVILGDGPLREYLTNECIGLGLKTYFAWENQPLTLDYNVYFLGYQQNPFKYISKSVAFVMSSGWEGFPMVLGEAMACKVPVISTDCPTGPKEILAPSLPYEHITNKPVFAEYGILMPMLQTEENAYEIWADALTRILQDESMLSKYSKASEQRIKDFNPDVTLERWKEIVNL